VRLYERSVCTVNGRLQQEASLVARTQQVNVVIGLFGKQVEKILKIHTNICAFFGNMDASQHLRPVT